MSDSSLARRAGRFALDFFEIYLPSVTMFFMFAAFVLSIFFRYFLNHPLTWPYELCLILFIWTTMFGAGYAKRDETHVVFSVIYDRMKPRARLISRIVAEVFVIVPFAVAFVPSVQYILFWKMLKSPALLITFDVVFAPYIVFMLLMIGRSFWNLVADLRLLRTGKVKP